MIRHKPAITRGTREGTKEVIREETREVINSRGDLAQSRRLFIRQHGTEQGRPTFLYNRES
jgi:hypothetical protein